VKKFINLPRIQQIAIVVLSIHLLSAFIFTGHHFFTKRFQPSKPIAVRTITPQPVQKSIIKPSVKTPSQPKTKPAPKGAPKEKKSKAVAQKKKEPVQEDVALLQEIAQSLETIDHKSDHPHSTLSIPTKIQPVAKEIPEKSPPSNGEFIIAFLQQSLDLPEFGWVKAKIEIDRFGKLVYCEILEAKSSKNANFLKNQLPELNFPPFNENQVFTITFTNSTALK